MKTPENMKKVAPAIPALLVLAMTAAGIGFPSRSHAQTIPKHDPSAATRISLFGVPLQCGSAPEIGCGSRAKPLLLKLEEEPGIAEAWLNGTGTVLAVVGREGSNREAHIKAVESVLEKAKATATELSGEARTRELSSFAGKNGWYRTVAVDDLSKQEAVIIAARLVRRIQARVSLPDEKARALATGFGAALERRFISSSGKSELNAKQSRDAALAEIAQAHLDPAGIIAFEAAVANGYRPQANEK